MIEPIAIGSIKLSLLFFYRRVFIYQVVHYIIWILVGFVVVWTLFLPIGYAISCANSMRANFRACPHSTYSMEKTWTIVDTVVDFVILIIPIPPVAYYPSKSLGYYIN